jgi:hypothetical protein
VQGDRLTLKDDHIRQALDYRSNSGVEWIVLTNGVYWRIYKVLFTRPVSHELVYEFDFTALNMKKQTDMEMLFYLTKKPSKTKRKNQSGRLPGPETDSQQVCDRADSLTEPGSGLCEESQHQKDGSRCPISNEESFR